MQHFVQTNDLSTRLGEKTDPRLLAGLGSLELDAQRHALEFLRNLPNYF